MEPDPAKNLSSSSKRRISSILKVPRKSAHFTDQEQQENVVERAKPVEKRISRRVSFAPADDVLLFSKDVKNNSSTPNDFQELLTGPKGPMQNRQVTVTEDGTQQILGIKNLLNAPLHDHPPSERDDFCTQGDFGEKTVMFSQQDAFMDMTNNTITNIVANLPGDNTFQSYELPNDGDKRVVFPLGPLSNNKTPSNPGSMTGSSISLFTGRNLDPYNEKTKGPLAAPSFDLKFEDILSNILVTSGTKVMPPAGNPSDDKNISLPPIKTQQVSYNEKREASASDLMAKALNTSRKSGNLPAAVWRRESSAMDMTEVQTGLHLRADDENPFKGLFPFQDMHADSDKYSSKTMQIMPQQQSSDTLTLNTTEGKKSVMNTSPQIPNQQSKVNADIKAGCSEETVMFTANEMLMDMTQSHTANIGHHFPGGELMSAKRSNPELKIVPGNQSSAREPSVNTPMFRMIPTAEPSLKDTFNTTGSLSHKTPEASDDKENMPMNSRRSVGALNQSAIHLRRDISADVRQSHLGSIITEKNEFRSRFSTPSLRLQSGPLTTIDGTSCQSTETSGTVICKGSKTLSKTASNTKIQTQQVECDAYVDCSEETKRFTAEDACMDFTQCQSVNIDHELLPHNEHLPASGEKTVRFNANDAAMDETICYTVKVFTDFDTNAPDLEPLHTCGEKTVRFSADDADIDITKSHTVNLISDFNVETQVQEPVSTCREKTLILTADDPASDEMRRHSIKAKAEPSNTRSHQSKDFPPSMGAKTLRLPSNCASTDITGSKTEDIATNLRESQDPEPPLTPGERTVMLLDNDAAMEVSSHTENIATDFAKMPPHQNVDYHLANQEKTLSLDVSTSNSTTNLQSHSQYVDLPTCGEEVKMVTADGGVVDVTRRHAGNTATDFPNLHSESLPATQGKTESSIKNVGWDVTRSNTVNTVINFESKSQNIALPTCDNKQTEFSAIDDCLEMTHCFTVNIDMDTAADLSPKHQHAASIHENVAFHSEAEDQTCGLPKERSSSVQCSDGKACEVEDPRTSLLQETVGQSSFLHSNKTCKPDNNTEDLKQTATVTESSENQSMADINASMDLTKAHESCVLGQSNADETSLIQESHFQHLKKSEMSLKRKSETPPDTEEGIKKLIDSHEADKTEAIEETQQIGLTCPLPQEMESFAPELDSDLVRSRNSRRKSLADLQSKLCLLKHTINAEPDPVDPGSCTAPQLDLVRNSSNKTALLLAEPNPQIEVDPQDQCLTASQQPPVSAATTPFTVRTTQLVSRLSVGSFRPKLPQRRKTEDVKKVNSEGDPAKTTRMLSHLSSLDHDVSDIYDEELGSLEDVFETLSPGSPQKVIEEHRSHEESEFKNFPLEDDTFQAVGAVQNQKRPLPDDEDMPSEKRVKAFTETVQMSDGADNDIDGTTRMTVWTTDSNSSHTASMRGEATFESTFKKSLFETQLEDHTSNLQTKLEDDTITVSEFLKYFNIDIVIHNPRQSVCPGRVLPDSEVTPVDLLKERHVSLPKQMVYEADVRTLTEKVERLKVRMFDLDKPLKTVNAPLWEEMKHCSEKELKSFGVKLKERYNFFRKSSKAQSHEMKEVLYSRLVQANQEEQQKLKGTIQKADEMIKSLDDCISNLETELAAVEETGFENKPSIRSLQEEMKKITETSADNERQVSDLEMQNHQNSSRITRLKAETGSLRSHLDMLNQLSEWKMKERTDDLTVFTFLHETMYLQLTYDKSSESVADCGSERKIARISFEFLLDEAGSQSHAHLVHKLVSQYIKGESAWEEKYPTSQHVPKLLLDVSLVVSRCRLLGEECRRLRMWGNLPYDILNFSCHDSKVIIVFSCLEKFAKFKVVFAISLVNRLYVVQLESFENKIGNITMEQIEEIVASFTPGKNLLTKIVKKIHQTLLT